MGLPLLQRHLDPVDRASRWGPPAVERHGAVEQEAEEGEWL